MIRNKMQFQDEIRVFWDITYFPVVCLKHYSDTKFSNLPQLRAYRSSDWAFI
jgi:hypothetical protein